MRQLGLLFWIYVLASAVTFGAYAFDKFAARQGRRRIRERTLHLLALCGGWPGAWLAQRLLHHKSVKRRFQAVFWSIVILHGLVLAWWVSRAARAVF